MTAAEALIGLVQVWFLFGAAVALVFLTIGIDRIDADARGAYVFRPLLIPAVLLLWPLVLWRWWVLETGRDQWHKRHKPPRRSHQIVAAVLAIAVVATIIVGLAIRQSWPADFGPTQLSQPAESTP